MKADKNILDLWRMGHYQILFIVLRAKAKSSVHCHTFNYNTLSAKTFTANTVLVTSKSLNTGRIWMFCTNITGFLQNCIL